MRSRILFANIVVLTVGLLFISSNQAWGQSSENPCNLNRIPAKIQQILNKNFSSWRIINLMDLAEEDQRFWIRSNKQNQCPGIAFGHYELDSALSYVFSLISRNNLSSGYRLVIFSANEKGSYTVSILEKSDSPANPLVVYTVPPGRYWNDEKNKSILLLREGFQSEQRDKGAFLYFWQKGSLLQMMISE